MENTLISILVGVIVGLFGAAFGIAKLDKYLKKESQAVNKPSVIPDIKKKGEEIHEEVHNASLNDLIADSNKRYGNKPGTGKSTDKADRG